MFMHYRRSRTSIGAPAGSAPSETAEVNDQGVPSAQPRTPRRSERLAQLLLERAAATRRAEQEEKVLETKQPQVLIDSVYQASELVLIRERARGDGMHYCSGVS